MKNMGQNYSYKVLKIPIDTGGRICYRPWPYEESFFTEKKWMRLNFFHSEFFRTLPVWKQSWQGKSRRHLDMQHFLTATCSLIKKIYPLPLISLSFKPFRSYKKLFFSKVSGYLTVICNSPKNNTSLPPLVEIKSVS